MSFVIIARSAHIAHLQVYAEPLGYWKNYYNLFDFTVLVISVLQSILTALNFGQTGLTVLRVVRGLLGETILVLLHYLCRIAKHRNQFI